MKLLIVFLFISIIGFVASQTLTKILENGDKINDRREIIKKYVKQIEDGEDLTAVAVKVAMEFAEAVNSPESEPTFWITKLAKRIRENKEES